MIAALAVSVALGAADIADRRCVDGGLTPRTREAARALLAEAQRLERDPSRQLEAWRPLRERPLRERVVPATPALAALGRTTCDPATGDATRPSPAREDDPLVAATAEALASLPPGAEQWARRFVFGVAIAEDFGYSGLTHMFEDDRGRPAGAIVVLNASQLRGTASAWATWKEKMPFRARGGVELAVKMEEGGDGRRALLQYVLLHEIGHVIALLAGIQTESGDVPSRREFFYDHAWTEEGHQSRFDAAFPQRQRLAYYREPRLDAAQARAAYEALAATNFPTMYAATNSGDDFAESFANYVHVKVLGRPFEVTIHENGHEVLRQGACWDEPRCAAKRRAVEWLLVPR